MKRIFTALGVVVVVFVVWLLGHERSDGDATARASTSQPAATTTTSTRAGATSRSAPRASSSGRLVLGGAWGTGPDDFGHRDAHESNPEGPMALAAGKNGILVLDQANGRVTRFDLDGKRSATFMIGPETAQDLAVDSRGRVAVLDRVDRGQVLLYDETGTLLNEVPVVGGPLTEAGGATGVFSDATGTYLEREHLEVVRVLGPDGQPDPDRPAKPGRPARSGNGFIHVAIADKARGVVTIQYFDHNGVVTWRRSLAFPGSMIGIAMVDSDLAGHIYLAAHTALESSTPPYALTDERIDVVRVAETDGSDAGKLVLPALTAAEETFRPLSVSDAGVIYQLVPGPRGLEIRAYTF